MPIDINCPSINGIANVRVLRKCADHGMIWCFAVGRRFISLGTTHEKGYEAAGQRRWKISLKIFSVKVRVMLCNWVLAVFITDLYR